MGLEALCMGHLKGEKSMIEREDSVVRLSETKI